MEEFGFAAEQKLESGGRLLHVAVKRPREVSVHLRTRNRRNTFPFRKAVSAKQFKFQFEFAFSKGAWGPTDWAAGLLSRLRCRQAAGWFGAFCDRDCGLILNKIRKSGIRNEFPIFWISNCLRRSRFRPVIARFPQTRQ